MLEQAPLSEAPRGDCLSTTATPNFGMKTWERSQLLNHFASEKLKRQGHGPWGLPVNEDKQEGNILLTQMDILILQKIK